MYIDNGILKQQEIEIPSLWNEVHHNNQGDNKEKEEETKMPMIWNWIRK